MNRIEQLKQFIAEDPADSFSKYALALEYAKMEKINEAIALLQEVLSTDENYLAAYYQIGLLYEKATNIEQAQASYEKGMRIAQACNNRHTFAELKQALQMLSGEEE